MTETGMTETGRAGLSRRETDPALAHDAARLLDRLRSEPLPAGERTAASLRQATRHAFILVEEIRKLAAAEAPARGLPRPQVQKNRVDRPFFLESDVPAAPGYANCVDLEEYRKQVRQDVALARKRA